MCSMRRCQTGGYHPWVVGGLFGWKAGSVDGTRGEAGAIAGATICPGSIGIINGGTAGMGFCRFGVSVAGAGANRVGDGTW